MLDLISFLFIQQFCNSIRKDFTLIYWSVSKTVYVYVCMCVCMCVNERDELYSISSYFWWKFITLKRKNTSRQKSTYSRRLRGCCFLRLFFFFFRTRRRFERHHCWGIWIPREINNDRKVFYFNGTGNNRLLNQASEGGKGKKPFVILFNVVNNGGGKCKCFFKIFGWICYPLNLNL